jgi:hypothetical protein
MALPSIAGAFWFENGVDFKHERSCFHPIITIHFSVKEPNVYSPVPSPHPTPHVPATQRTLRQIALSTERRLEIGRSVPSSTLPQFSYIVDLLGAASRHDMP